MEIVSIYFLEMELNLSLPRLLHNYRITIYLTYQNIANESYKYAERIQFYNSEI